jgi:DNA topoisomerase-2
MYIGAVDITSKDVFILENDKFYFKTISYNPGFLKIFDEILDNSIDEAIRTNFEFANTISIYYNDEMFTIEDNGRGVPQSLIDGVPQAVIAFTEARAGSNFNESTKANGIGTNGIGSFLTNVYSKYFNVETCDGKNKLTLTSINNAESFTYNIKSTTKKGTSVSFKPDLEKFKMQGVDDIYFDLIKNRCLHLAQCFPEIKFKLEIEGK